MADQSLHWMLAVTFTDLSEESRMKYLEIFQSFETHSNFDKIKRQYDKILESVYSFLEQFDDPYEVRTMLAAFFTIKKLNINPAQDKRVLAKCQEILQNKPNKSSSPTKNSNMKRKSEATYPLINSKIDAYLETLGKAKDTVIDYKAKILRYLNYCTKEKWDANGSVEDSIDVLLRYFESRNSINKIPCATLRTERSAIKVYYDMMECKDDLNPTLSTKIKKYFENLEYVETQLSELAKKNVFEDSSSSSSISLSVEMDGEDVEMKDVDNEEPQTSVHIEIQEKQNNNMIADNNQNNTMEINDISSENLIHLEIEMEQQECEFLKLDTLLELAKEERFDEFVDLITHKTFNICQ